MKTNMMIGLLLIGLTQELSGQASTNFLFRYRAPVVNDKIRCDLTPLFSWWSQQLAAQEIAHGTNTMVKTNEAASPMPAWAHISGDLVDQTPQGWVVSGVVETAPNVGSLTKVLVIHPPRNEPGRFAQKLAALKNPPAQPDYSEQEAQINLTDNRAFVANAIGDPDLQDYYATEAARQQHELDNQKQQDRDAENRRLQSVSALGDFPADWEAYQVDLFALNTGRQQNGMPVYDAGLSFER
jgi:hypothetical protein